MKKLFVSLILVTILLIEIPINVVFATSTDKLTIYSPVALLMEKETGKILYNKNGEERRYNASTTKLMTAILTVENCELADVAKVSYNAVFSVPSDYTNAALKVDEELTIEQLLHVLLIPSANDAANVLAEHIAGSIESFATMMNTKAIELGCTGTNFVNPSGIHNDNHYSTAHDLALIGRYAMKNETIMSIVSKTSYTLPITNKYDKEDRYFVTTNSMLRPNFKKYYYEYTTGLKTGYTEHSLDCIVATAKKDDMEFIVVILGAGYNQDGLRQKYLDCHTLFEYGFNNYSRKQIIAKNEVYDKIKIKGATSQTEQLDLVYENNIDILIENSQIGETIHPKVNIKENIQAPIKKGDIIGAATYDIEGLTYTSNILAGNDVEKSDMMKMIFRIVLIILILFILSTIFGIKNKKGKKRRRYK